MGRIRSESTSGVETVHILCFIRVDMCILHRTSKGVAGRFGGVYWRSPHVKARFEPKFSVPSKIDWKFAFLAKMGSKCKNSVFGNPKGTSLRRTTSFYALIVKIGATALGIASCQNPPPKKKSHWTLYTQFRVYGAKVPDRIVKKFCITVGIRNTISDANFGSHRFRLFRVAWCRISGFSIDFQRRPYDTLALPCQRVISHASWI